MARRRIKHLSPHQNGKVVGIMMAATSLIFLVPMIIGLAVFGGSASDAAGNPIDIPYTLLLLAPVFYLVMGYLMALIACAIYNFLFGNEGGVEFEMTGEAPY